jgi:hypothetical protein
MYVCMSLYSHVYTCTVQFSARPARVPYVPMYFKTSQPTEDEEVESESIQAYGFYILIIGMYIRGEEPVTFGRPLPVHARDFKKLRPVPRKFESRDTRPGTRAATGGPRHEHNFKKNPVFLP